MRNIWKRTLALICALILCSSCAEALAEFSPRLAEMEKGEGMTVSLKGSLDSLSPLSKQSAAIVNEWLSHLEVLCSVGKSTQAELKMDGESIYALSVQKQNRAVGLYRAVGFQTLRETPEEYIMVCPLDA